LSYVLIALALASAIADWVGVANGNKRLEYVFKPLTIVFLLAFTLLHPLPADEGDRQRIAIAAALAFSLAGDVFLMQTKDMFVAGLASFLVAHLCYVVAFSPLPPIGETWPVIVVVAIVAGTLLSIMVRAMLEKGKRSLVGPVVAYVAAIGAMVVAAVSTLIGDAPMPAAAFAAGGAILFMASDSLIGWHRFVRELRWAPVAIIVTYHLGQTGLVLSLVR
jgi:uncharacterized membrane protein YhhN